jgi:methionyl-tRNA synthetase
MNDDDRALVDGAAKLLPGLRDHMSRQEFHKALQAILAAVGEADSYIDANAPWALGKTDPARMATVLYVLAETIRNVAIVLQPFTPDAAAKILDQLAVAADSRAFANLGVKSALVPGTSLPAPRGVFPRLEAEPAV